ncbi:MAG: Ser-Thr-rich GPI-anchored membrane family protein [Syntrophobacteraceae bacterium]
MDLRMDCSSVLKKSRACLPFWFPALIAFLLTIPAPAHGGWKLERVDGPKFFHDYRFSNRSIALYASRPHIVYGGDHLYHAWLEDDTWQYEVVDDSGGVGSSAAIAIDPAGKIHVAYRDDQSQPGIKYATNAAGRWNTFVVDSTESQLYNVSIALDRNEKAHVCYYDGVNEDLKYATNATGTWRTYTIDSLADKGKECSIAVDSQNKVHISYCDNYYGDLKYATNSSGKWVLSVLHSGNIPSGYGTSIAVDSKDKVHISFLRRGAYNSLLYCSNATGSWHTQVIDSIQYLGECSSLGLDSDDKVHISYYDGTDQNLKYITNATQTGEWQAMPVDSAGDVGRYNAIAVTGSGDVHMAYLDYTKNTLKYATGDLGGFTRRTIDRSGKIDWRASLAVDKNNKLHVAYIDDFGEVLKYATNASGSWKRYTVDSTFNFSTYYLSIAVDGDNKAHIAYYGSLRELRYTTNASGSWKTIAVDSSADVGAYPSIAMDRSNNPHISYCDRDNNTLKYATKVSGDWQIATLDSISYVGEDTSIAVDSGNKVHISYFGGQSYDLMYATNKSGAWKKYTVDTEGFLGWFTSIAVDSLKKVHISYMDLLNSNVKYATNASGAWKTTSLNTSAEGGWGNAIAVDSNRKVHISYLDETAEDLKYATNASGSWKYSFVDRRGDVGSYNDIAVDSHNKVHIVYRDNSNCDLKHATNASSLFPLQVDKFGTGVGLVTGSTGKTDCGATCEGHYAKGATEILTAKASGDSRFVGWDGSCSGKAPCTVTMNGYRHVTARFDLKLPMAPSRLTALAMSATQIDLTWKDNSNNESGFSIERKKGTAGTYALVGEVGPNVTAFSDGGLDPETRYFYRVRAYESSGVSSYSNEANAVTTLFIKVSFPNGGVHLLAGAQWWVQWTYSGNVGTTVNIDLLKGGAYYKTITSSQSIGKEGYGQYNRWRIPYNETPGSDYKVRITSTTDSNYQDTSNSNFSIMSGIGILSPNGGEIWKAGSTQKIHWTYSNEVHATVKIELYRGGVPDLVINPAISKGSNGEGEFSWTIPASQAASNLYKVKITSADNLFSDASDDGFTILPP